MSDLDPPFLDRSISSINYRGVLMLLIFCVLFILLGFILHWLNLVCVTLNKSCFGCSVLCEPVWFVYKNNIYDIALIE